MIDNVTARRYSTYGAFVQVDLSGPGFTIPRVHTAGPPIGAFGGVRVTF